LRSVEGRAFARSDLQDLPLVYATRGPVPSIPQFGGPIAARDIKVGAEALIWFAAVGRPGFNVNQVELAINQ
jgi:hypothetical protein